MLQLLQQGHGGHHERDQPEDGQAEQQADPVGPEPHSDADGDHRQHQQPDEGGPRQLVARAGNLLTRVLKGYDTCSGECACRTFVHRNLKSKDKLGGER